MSDPWKCLVCGELIPVPDRGAVVDARTHHIARVDQHILAHANGVRLELAQDCQAFFDAYHAESLKPHCAANARDWIRELLRRAEEAGLYTPPVTVERQDVAKQSLKAAVDAFIADSSDDNLKRMQTALGVVEEER